MSARKTPKADKVCFVIAPIGEPESETRKVSDQVFKHIVSPVVQEFEFNPVRADHISEPGIITSQVIQYVVQSPLVVADLTGRNPNVFYELAIRHAIKKPLAQLIRKGEQMPFDVAGTRTIQFDIHDLDNVEEVKKELRNQIDAVLSGNAPLDTPISVALDLQFLRESENPEQRSLADVIEAITELRSAISSIEKRLNDPSSIFPREFLDQLMGLRRYGINYREHAAELLSMVDALVELVETGKLSRAERGMMRDRLHVLRHRLERYIRQTL